eukprot:3019801-Prymnesium_polylepis.2
MAAQALVSKQLLRPRSTGHACEESGAAHVTTKTMTMIVTIVRMPEMPHSSGSSPQPPRNMGGSMGPMFLDLSLTSCASVGSRASSVDARRTSSSRNRHRAATRGTITMRVMGRITI